MPATKSENPRPCFPAKTRRTGFQPVSIFFWSDDESLPENVFVRIRLLAGSNPFRGKIVSLLTSAPTGFFSIPSGVVRASEILQ